MKIKNVIGLDIGARDIKLVNLALKGKSVELLKFEIIEMPKTSSQYEIIDLLKTAFRRNQLKLNIPICLAISAEESFFKIISVKSKASKKLVEVVKNELKKNVVFSLEDCIWDYFLLRHKPKEMIKEVLSVAAKKEAVLDKIQLIEKFNGFAHLINLDVLATYNCLKFNTELASGKLYALVDISSVKTQVFIFNLKGNFWLRTLPFGGDKFTDAIAKNLSLSFKEAQEHKKNMLLQENTDAKPDDALMPLMKEISTELDKTFNYYYFQARESAIKEAQRKIDEILLCGGGSLCTGLDKFLSDTLNIPTSYIYPLNKIQIRNKKILAKRNMLNTQSPELATAIGLALEGLNFADIKINLVKQTRESIFKKIKLSYIFNFLIVVCIGVLVFLGTQRSALTKQSKELKSKLNELNIVSQKYMPEITSLKEIYEETNSKINDTNTVVNNRNLIRRILHKTSEVIAEDVWITNFIINLNYQEDTGELTLSGKSMDYAGINKLISGLRDTGYFKEIKPVSSKVKIDGVTKEEIVNFIIKLEVGKK